MARRAAMPTTQFFQTRISIYEKDHLPSCLCLAALSDGDVEQKPVMNLELCDANADDYRKGVDFVCSRRQEAILQSLLEM